MTEFEQFKTMLDRAGVRYEVEKIPYMDGCRIFRLKADYGLSKVWIEFNFDEAGRLGIVNKIIGGTSSVGTWCR